MSTYFSKKVAEKLHRFLAMMIIVSIVGSLVPSTVFAEGEVPPVGTTQQQQATSTPVTASSTENTPPNGGTASSTESGTDGGNGTGQDGVSGIGGTENGGNASTTNATSTPQGDSGAEGTSGDAGTAGATSGDEVTPVEVISDVLLGDIDAPEEEENTGDIRQNGTNTFIETGIATAQGQLSTDANSNDIRSELEGVRPSDFDTYTFVATGTNDAIVSNDGLTRGTSGDNLARGRNTATVHTGDAVSAFNIANVINSNVVNSDGFIYLANKILEDGQSLDLTDSFFPDPEGERALSETCSLLSCTAEDVVYNVSQINHATVTNNALIEAVTGFNEADGGLRAEITTGDAYAAANVLNVVNSNIIDSNYRLLTYNAIGDLDGDLILPTGAMFDTFFSRPNGTNQVEDFEDVHLNVHNINEANVDTNLDASAETGQNHSTTAFNSSIVTGRAESESNVLNKINENTYGGDSMYLLIRVHGEWNGDVVGLPDGLAWEWTPLGIVIYNVDAEIAPSEFLGYDQDSYTANFSNNNRIALENNVTLNAITGENEIDGLIGNIKTGNAFASANVMNIANTNIVGTNWTYAVINILGDFEGNISFTATDIALTGSVAASKSPIGPSTVLTYTYTITNHSNSTATNVVLDQTLQFARTNANQTTQSASLGTIAAGASKQVVLTAKVNPDIATGTTSVVAYASVGSDQGDENNSDNLLMLSVSALNPRPTPGGAGTTTGNGTGTTTNPGGNPNGTTTPPTYAQATYYAQGAYNSGASGGGGGGGGSTTKTKVKREEVKKVINPNSAPLLTIKKVAVNVGKKEIINAGESVDYKITVSNAGGNAYDAEVFDVLTNPIDSVMSEQSWDLGTILPGESIDLTYTTEYNPNTPSGKYTNTASVKAYHKDGVKEKHEAPLKVKDAVYIVQVKGLDLAIGNVSVLAYFPGANGKTSALVSWETSKLSLSQVFYGITGVSSPYNPDAVNLGYQNGSYKFPNQKVKHVMIISGLDVGRTYSYRINAVSDKHKATSREYNLTLPAVVARIMHATADTMVAGAAVSIPTPVAPVVKAKYVPPKPAPKPVVVPVPAPAPVTTSVAPAPAEQKQGGVAGFVKNVFGFFR